MGERIEHTISPFIYKEARVLLLGSLPSPKSREQGFYYGHPHNRFWRVLSAVFNEELPQTIEDKKTFLRLHRIALWDVVESCEIIGASDASIRNVEYNDVRSAIEGTDIIKVFTTGTTAYKLLVRSGGVDAICLPSTSPANCAVSFEKLVEEYAILTKYV